MTMRESMQKFCAVYCPQATSWVDQLQFVENQWGMFFTWQREQYPLQVAIEVRGGVAEVLKAPAGVEVEIIDHDNA